MASRSINLFVKINLRSSILIRILLSDGMLYELGKCPAFMNVNVDTLSFINAGIVILT